MMYSILSREKMKAAEKEYALRSHPTKRHTPATNEVLKHLSHKAQSKRQDVWAELTEIDHPASGKKVNGHAIKAAFRSYMDSIQDGRCCYCRNWLVSSAHAKPIEHILPRSDYPQYSLHFWNLAVACADCNGKKSNSVWGGIPKKRRTYPLPSAFTDLFHPRFHRYHEHIRYVFVETNTSSIAVYEGLTVQGRHLCNELLNKIAAKRAFYSSNTDLKESKKTLDEYMNANSPIQVPSLLAFQELLDKSVENLLGID